MLDTVLDLFSRRNPRREAVVGLARILNRHDAASLSFHELAEDDRRENAQRKVSWGVWLFAADPGTPVEEVPMDRGLPAITQDLRREGIGILTPLPLTSPQFLVALPEDPTIDAYAPERSSGEIHWTFFRCDTCHNTRLTGGWYQLGLQVCEMAKLSGEQQATFREHVAAVVREADV